MSTTRIRLETSDFTVTQTGDGRIHVFVDGERDAVELDLDPEVASDLFLALANPEEDPVLMTWLRRHDLGAGAERAVLGAVLAIAALISYTHLRDVWLAAGSPWPDLGPLLVDGLFAAAWLRMRRRRRQGDPVGWLAWAALGLALVATLAGNVTAALVTGHTSWLSIVVAGWPAVAFALVWELVTGHDRRPAVLASGWGREDVATPLPPGDHPAGDPPAPAGGDDRAAELVAAGAGRRKLSRELGISEHEARQLLAGRTNGHQVVRT